MATSTPVRKRDVFVNESPGYAGAVRIDPVTGEEKGIPVGPGEQVALTYDEQIATANAPRDPADNPLRNGTFKLVAEGGDVDTLRPLRPDPNETDESEPELDAESVDVEQDELDAEETGKVPPPVVPAAPRASRPPGEEAGTPQAVEASAKAAGKPRPAPRRRQG